MKRTVFLLLFLLWAGSSPGAHKFYVSITEILYVQEKKQLQVSTKVFYDDLQNAIYIEDGKEVTDPLTDYEETLNSFLQRHLKVYVNGQKIPLKLQTTDVQVDAVWFTFHSEPLTNNIQSLSVYNDVFVDLFATQSNIINFFPDSENTQKVEGLLLTRKQKKGTIHLN